MLADVHIYGGLAVLAGGLAWLNPPFGLIALGLGFILLGVSYALREEQEPEETEVDETSGPRRAA